MVWLRFAVEPHKAMQYSSKYPDNELVITRLRVQKGFVYIDKTIMVIGAGQMGSGITQVAAQAGFSVIMQDVKEEWLKLSKKPAQDGHSQPAPVLILLRVKSPEATVPPHRKWLRHPRRPSPSCRQSASSCNTGRPLQSSSPLLRAPVPCEVR